MENKKPVFLTIIAAVTLLLAVVGATFAYFNVTGENDEEKTTVNVSTKKLGTVSLSNPTTDPLHLTIRAVDMATNRIGNSYYATTEEYPFENDKNVVEVAKGIVVGGEPDTVYICDFNLTVNVSGTMAEFLQPGDIKVGFETGGIYLYDLYDYEIERHQEYDLSEGSETFNANFFIIPNEATTKSISAYVVMNNRGDTTDSEGNLITSGNQNYLADKSLTVEFSNSNFHCDVAET